MFVTPALAALMARYNLWQNEAFLAAADTMDTAAREADRGAFFGSIAGTFSHILWADLTWLSRFEGSPAPDGRLENSATLFADWQGFRERRAAVDRRIMRWADRLTPEALAGDLSWNSAVLGGAVTRPFGLCAAHFFNHQTHHRGQIHAMLTAAGAGTGHTDLCLIPEEIGL